MADQDNLNKNAARSVKIFVRSLGEGMLLDYGPYLKKYPLYQNNIDYSEFTRAVIIHRIGWENITNGFFEYDDKDMIEVLKGDSLTHVIEQVGRVEFHKLIAPISDREERYLLMNLEDKEMAHFIANLSLIKKWRLYLPPS